MKRSWLFAIGYAGLLALASSLFKPDRAIAQVVPDNSLGAESSTVGSGFVNGLPADVIEGGAQRSQNLFHSFQDFSIELGDRVYFTPSAAIDRIFSRVTGEQISNIDGLLGVASAADLYFLNPNGIVFGETASLDLTGSFFATTDSKLTFADGYEYQATPAVDSVLLTVSIPIGLPIESLPQQGTIENRGSLFFSPNQSVTFLGNRLQNSGALLVPGGNLTLIAEEIAIADSSFIDASALEGGGTIFIGTSLPQPLTLSHNVPIANRVWVGPNTFLQANAGIEGNGGQVVIRAKESAYIAGVMSARGGSLSGDGGLIDIDSPVLFYQGSAGAIAPAGNTGTLALAAGNIEITNDVATIDSAKDFMAASVSDVDSQIDALSLSLSLASLSLRSAQDIVFNDVVSILIPVDVSISAPSGTVLVPQDALLAITAISVPGFLEKTGQIAIQADQLSVRGGSITSTSLSTGDENGLSSRDRSTDIAIQANRVDVLDNGFISSANLGESPSGNIEINATESLRVSDGGFVDAGAIFSANPGGTLTIRSPQILLDGGQITASSLGEGRAGSVNLLDVDNLTIRNNGLLAASGVQTNSGSGDIFVQAQTIVLEDGGQISVVAPSNDGGNITLEAAQYILLRNGSTISAEAGTQAASNLIIPTENLGAGGNIIIQTPFLIAPASEDSNISADAFLESGGRVQISATGIFGLQERTEQSPLSDITASSAFGTDGIVELNAPDTSFIQNNTVDLPTAPVDTNQLIAGSCIARAQNLENTFENTFVVRSTNSLPQPPLRESTSAFPTGSVRSTARSSTSDRPLEMTRAWQRGEPIVEPSEVYSLAEGRTILSHRCPQS